MSFASPEIITPANCDSPAPWLYQAVASDPTMLDSMQVTVDSDSNLVSWQTLPSFAGMPTPGTSYEVIVNAFIPGDNNTFEKVEAFKFNIIIDCCVSPTILTAPIPGQAAYVYNMGEAALDTQLSGYF